jgi:hypothetical protein
MSHAQSEDSVNWPRTLCTAITLPRGSNANVLHCRPRPATVAGNVNYKIALADVICHLIKQSGAALTKVFLHFYFTRKALQSRELVAQLEAIRSELTADAGQEYPHAVDSSGNTSSTH